MTQESLSSLLRRLVQPRWRRPVIATARVVLAATTSWIVASFGLHVREPVLAPLVAVLTVQGTVIATVRKASSVSAGVLLGASLGVGLGLLAGNHWWTIAVVTAVGVSTRYLPGLSAASADQMTVSALLVVALGQGYGYVRVVDTALGAAIGVLVVLVVLPPVEVPESVGVLADLAADMARILRDMADGVASDWDRHDATEWLGRARSLEDHLARARSSLSEAEESLRWNPRRSRAGPTRRLREAGTALDHAVGQVRAVARGLADLASDEQREAVTPPALPEAYSRLLSCGAAALDGFRRLLSEQADPDELDHAIERGRAHAEELETVLSQGDARRNRIWGSLREEPVRLLGELSPDGAHQEVYG